MKPKRKVRFTPEQELAMLRNRQDLIAFVLGFKSWKALEQFSCPHNAARIISDSDCGAPPEALMPNRVTKCPQCGVNKLAHGEFCDDTPGIATPELPMANRTEPVTFVGLEEEWRSVHLGALHSSACADDLALLRQRVEALRDKTPHDVIFTSHFQKASSCALDCHRCALDALLGKAGT